MGGKLDFSLVAVMDDRTFGEGSYSYGRACTLALAGHMGIMGVF